MAILEEISEFIQKGKAKNIKELVPQAIEQGLSAKEILEEGLLKGMNIIGERFKNNEVFVPEVLVAARAMNTGTALLKPLLIEAGAESKGVAIIGTVKGDLHDIGKNLVKMMMEGKGLDVIDLGVDVPAETFLQNAKEHNAQLVCCSALLTTTMGEIKTTIDLFEEDGYKEKVKFMIGGAPVTQEFCDKIGADSYTPDGATAADEAIKLLEAM